MTERWRVGVDIGGTFTDVMAIAPRSGEFRLAKVRTVPRDPLAGITDGLRAVDLSWEAVGELVHGTTMVTNALIESRLAKVALVATRGFSDVLDIARASRDELYRLDALPKRRADVPRDLRFEVSGRMDFNGDELEPLDEHALSTLADRIAATEAEAVAVCLLHSYVNEAHERAVRRVLEDRFPFVSVSHEVSPEAREFERTMTTVLNASMMPRVGRYIDRLSETAPETTHVRLFHSSGGMTSPAHAKERPLALALSGPAAGAAGAAAVARELGLDQVISFDMGGTTTDVCLVLDGKVEITNEHRISGRPIRQPTAAIETIGAGGGSIVSLKSHGLFVGPESAGADPGPACYGFGGESPTLADADLLLGYLDEERLLGGEISLDKRAASRALAPIAESLSQSIEATALGVTQLADVTMARAVRRVSVERGVDPRDCTLIAFGGSGPMHACGLANETGISRVIVPAASAVFSALGCVTARSSFSVQQTVRLKSGAWDSDVFRELRRNIAEAARKPLLDTAESRSRLDIEEVALVRYSGQSGTVEVPLSPDDGVADIDTDFHRIHEKLYGFATHEDWILESLRVTAWDSTASPTFVPFQSTDDTTALSDIHCHFPGFGSATTPRISRATIGADFRADGPALIVDEWSTTVVDPRFEVRATDAGHLLLQRKSGS